MDESLSVNDFLITVVGFVPDVTCRGNYFFHDYITSENSFLTKSEIKNYLSNKKFNGAKISRLTVTNIIKLGIDKC